MPRRCVFLVVLATLQGCYSYAPLETGVPPVGEMVELTISDRGRVELSERLGRGVSQIEGRLTGMTDDQLLINVAGISYVSGETSRWSGEAMRLDRGFVESASVRRLSRKRSWVAAAAVTLGVTLFILTRGLLVDFFGESDRPPVEEPPISFRP
jgi:hypothetical protein